jgi:hypothetical protein
MNNTFDPAAVERSANGKVSAADDEPGDGKREAASGDSRPASGAVSVPQPAKSSSDAHPIVVEDGEHGPRHARHPA